MPGITRLLHGDNGLVVQLGLEEVPAQTFFEGERMNE